MRIIVTGVPGVGKTSVMEGCAQRIDHKIINYGTAMFEIAREEGHVTKRDEMRSLPTSTQRQIQKKAVLQMKEMGDVIIDTHSTIKTPEGYYPGLPKSVLDDLEPDLIVLVEADAAEIAGRRSKDNSRLRDEEMIDQIQEHQDLNRMMAMSYSAISGAAVKIVMNNDGRVSEAVESLLTGIV